MFRPQPQHQRSSQTLPLQRPTPMRYKSHGPAEAWSVRAWLTTPRTYQGLKLRRIALTALCAVSLTATALVFHSWLMSGPSSPPPLPRPQAYPYSYSARVRVPQPAAAPDAYQFDTPAVELGALVGFLSALASNSLPETVDPGHPLDPDVVLGFHPRGSHADDDVLNSIEDVWVRNPVVLFTDVHRGNPPASRELKGIFESLKLAPEPTIFDVDERVDEEILRPLLRRITGATTFPIAIVGGRPILSMNELRDMRDAGRLNEQLAAAGAVVNGRKVKQGRKH